MNTSFLFRICLLLTLSTHSGISLAGIQVGGTRVVFPATDREASLQVRNEGTEDIMIQSWIEAAPGQASGDVPFAITPSLARLSHRKQQTLRIFYHGKGLAQDRESVVWLNVQEIPQISPLDNNLQVAIRQRMKLFYRPHGLSGTADEAASKLKWTVLKTTGAPVLQALNDSAFHVSFAKVSVTVNQKEYALGPSMISPRNSEKMQFKGFPATFTGDAQLHWESIDDYGALIKHQASVRF